MGKKTETLSPFSRRIKFGPVSISIMASSRHASLPQEDGLEPTKYTHFELALYQGRCMVAPRDLGLDSFQPYWGDDAVGKFVSAQVVGEIEAAMRAQYGQDEEVAA